MLAAALKRFSKCSVKFERRGRTLNGFGGFVTAKTEECTHKAFINFKELRKLAVNIDDAYSEDTLPIIIQGDQSFIEINDTAIIDTKTYKVRAVRFRPFGKFTNVLLKRIKRRALTV